jgi:hypothetical protein
LPGFACSQKRHRLATRHPQQGRSTRDVAIRLCADRSVEVRFSRELADLEVRLG